MPYNRNIHEAQKSQKPPVIITSVKLFEIQGLEKLINKLTNSFFKNSRKVHTHRSQKWIYRWKIQSLVDADKNFFRITTISHGIHAQQEVPLLILCGKLYVSCTGGINYCKGLELWLVSTGPSEGLPKMQDLNRFKCMVGRKWSEFSWLSESKDSSGHYSVILLQHDKAY